MRFAVTGSKGQLGRCLVADLEAGGEDRLAVAWAHSDLDLVQGAQVSRLFDDLPGGPPDVLVNAAAFTAVDRCESESELAMRVNGEAPGLLAEVCAEAGVRLVHVSTDYVFGGEGRAPFDEQAPTAPACEYGRSKLEGERRVLAASPRHMVVRTSWVFGPGRNFVVAILGQARLRRSGEVTGPLRVVNDQIGCPTYAADLAQGIRALARAGTEGLVHLCNQGATSWFDFARAILDGSGFRDLAIDPIATRELDLPAARPPYSVLDCSRAAALGVALRPWREALGAYLASPAGTAAREGV